MAYGHLIRNRRAANLTPKHGRYNNDLTVGFTMLHDMLQDTLRNIELYIAELEAQDEL